MHNNIDEGSIRMPGENKRDHKNHIVELGIFDVVYRDDHLPGQLCFSMADILWNLALSKLPGKTQPPAGVRPLGSHHSGHYPHRHSDTRHHLTLKRQL